MKTNEARIAISAAAVLLFATACGGGSTTGTGAEKLTPVSVRTDIFYNGGHLPLIVGIQRGIYKKHGLSVTSGTGTGSGTTVQLVGTGSDDIGFADAGVLTQNVAKGMKARMIMGIYQTNPAAVVLQQGSTVTSVSELAGKTGGFAPGSAMELIFPAVAKAGGLDLNTVKKQQMDLPTRDSLFVQGKFDFAFSFVNVTLPIWEAKCHCTYHHVLRYSDYGVNPLSNGYIVGEAFEKSNPKAVRAFAQATQEAIGVVRADPDAAVQDFFDYVKHTDLTKAEVKQQWEATNEILSTKASRDLGPGCMAKSDWANTIDILEKYAELPKGAVTPDDVFTNKYLNDCT